MARLKGCEAGGPMVEFAMVLPLILLFIAVIVEGGRITWIHQAAAAGVRDAARMVARTASADLCPSGSVAGYDSMVTKIVEEKLDGSPAMPMGATVQDVIPNLICRTGSYRISPAAVIEITAQVRITYIFGGVFGLFGAPLGPLVTEISDQSRVYGV